MSAFVWAMMGLAVWHLTVFLPERFPGGIAGALAAALAGAFAGGFLLPEPGLNGDNPPGLEPVWSAGVGSVAGLVVAAAWELVRGQGSGPGVASE